MSKSIQIGPNPRLIAVSGGGGPLVPPGYTVVAMDGMNHFTIDLANGSVPTGSCFVIVLATASTDGATPPNSIATIVNPIWTGGTITDACSFDLFVEQDSTGGWPFPALTSGPGGFTAKSYTKAFSELDGDGNGCTYIRFTKHGSKWGLSVITPGVSLS